jgi:hypothetical protein
MEQIGSPEMLVSNHLMPYNNTENFSSTMAKAHNLAGREIFDSYATVSFSRTLYSIQFNQ